MVYVPSEENCADLLTKMLTKKLHDKFSERLLVMLVDGEGVMDFKKRKTVSCAKIDAPLEKLYQKSPRGLLKEDMLLGPEQRSRENGGAAEEKSLSVLDEAQGATWRAVLKGVLGLARVLFKELLKEMDESCAVALIENAIVDSGASYTYVTDAVELENARPGSGVVSVANGRLEPIKEIGDLGPIRRARKVSSFPRTLVSVRDLVESVGAVRFA